MKIGRHNKSELYLKIVAIGITVMLVTSSVAFMSVMVNMGSLDGSETIPEKTSFQKRPCDVKSVLTQAGTWISFDSSSPGTPAEAHVTISDTSGITIVADFHGFWRNNHTINGTVYDDPEMPGASSMQVPGAPMLPCLFEYVEIPHDVDISIDVISSSNDTKSGYSIRPAPPPAIPFAAGESGLDAATPTALSTFFGPVYSQDSFFPGITTGTEGGSNATALVMRGHRLLGLGFYPVQYNPVNATLLVHSQLVIKVKYSRPAQIQPVAESLRSEAFELIFVNILLNYDSFYLQCMQEAGFATICPPPPPDFQEGAEYLIITTETFKAQANRLADWKEQKGVPSEVVIVQAGASAEDVKTVIDDAYNTWYPAPTYVLLLGDVEVIPANYDADHEARISTGPFSSIRVYQQQDHGIIASDLGYFNVDGQGYFPDMIYSRISVDTEEQARIIVDKIIQYEQSPPVDDSFYSSILSAGYFQDRAPRNGREDELYPFIYNLEAIRHYLKDNHGYDVYINYSCAWEAYDSAEWDSPDYNIPLEDLEFQEILDATGSKLLRDSLPAEFFWLKGYDSPPHHREYARKNITANINEGRFFIMYYDHGGSKNMIYPIDWAFPLNGVHNRNDRDIVEGWHQPYYNTSYFSDLSNGDLTPLIVSIACNTGWFDGETDQDYMDLDSLGEPNPFSDYENECFAENITRLEGGGAIAIIAPSRIAYSVISGHLLDGIIQAFWPGHLEPENQPIYEMGTALLFAKLYSATQWTDGGLFAPIIDPLLFPEHKLRTTFEEYHLFGDPETQLWTDVPSQFNVSYPMSVGTSDPQRFVVTVNKDDTSVPVNFAKVCIQQEEDIYQVGYTNSRGQVIFDVSPSNTPSHINVTVTKHNFRPHIGIIHVHASEAEILLSQYTAIVGEQIEITFTGFTENRLVKLTIDDYLIATGIETDTPYVLESVPSGANGYLNVWAAVIGAPYPPELWSPVSVERLARISEEEGPDPYIYSQDDRSTWEDPTGEVAWDNPDIIIKQNGVTMSSMTQNVDHSIEVIVHNRGCDTAEPTTVTLSYAPFGGGVSWTEIGEYDVNPIHGGTDIAYFTLTPPIPHSACLRVDLDHTDELPENRINNIGFENVDVIEMSSPGTGSFQVGNPTGPTNYVFIKVKQQGNLDDIWNATILDYSSQAMNTGVNETITLFIDPLTEIEPDEWPIFTVEVYVN